MAKKIILITFSLSFGLFFTNGQDSALNTFERKAYLSLYNWPGVFGMGVKGQMMFNGKKISFNPERTSFFNPFNDCIKPLSVERDQILNLRRNWFILIPNRLVLKTKDKRTFRFLMYGQRKKLIRLVRAKTN